SQLRADEDGCRPVRPANDPDRGRLFTGEAEEQGREQSPENPQLCRGAEEDGAWLRKQGTEVGQGSDAQEDERREEPELDPAEQHPHDTGIPGVLLATAPELVILALR